jgi:hypothetical protein
VGLAFGGIRHRIVSSCREKRLKMKKKAHAQLGFLVGGTPSSHGQWFAAFYRNASTRQYALNKMWGNGDATSTLRSAFRSGQ